MIPFLAGVTVFFIFLSLRPQQPSLVVALRKFTDWKPPSPEPTIPIQRRVLFKLAQFTPKRWQKTRELDLMRANIPLTGGEFWVIQVGMMVALYFITALISREILAGFILGLLGFMLPTFYLRRARNKQLRLFNGQLGDASLMMGNSLKAGFSFLQAMEMSSREMAPPLSVEWGIALKEMNLGVSTEQALEHLADRVGSPDLDLMVTAILIQRQVGGNLSEVLMNIHDTIQDRSRIQKEIRTLTAQGRISGYMIACLPFLIAIILLVINPSYLKLLVSSPLGWEMIGGGLVSQTVGFLFIRKIVNIKA